MAKPDKKRPRKALFLHIQKTAGTSIQELAVAAYGRDQVCSHGDYWNLRVEGCAKLDFVSGHFGYAFATQLMKGRYSFTILRDPIERLLSLYSFCKTRDPDEYPIYKAAQEHDLLGFLSLTNSPFYVSLNNNITWMLTLGWAHQWAGLPTQSINDHDPTDLLQMAATNLGTFDYVGFVETIDQDTQRIFSDLGAPARRVRQTNKSPKKTRFADLPEATRERLLELTALDRPLFDYARATYLPANARRAEPSLLDRIRGRTPAPAAPVDAAARAEAIAALRPADDFVAWVPPNPTTRVP